MGNRSCPLCFVRLPRSSVLARSDELICPSCHAELEVARLSRVTAALLGVIAAYIAARLTLDANPRGAWFIAVVVAVLAYGFASALFLFFLSDLALRPKRPAESFPQIHS